MIDVQKQVFSALYNSLCSYYPGIEVGSAYTNKPSSFPYVSIIESDNRQSHLDNSSQKYATLLYEINVYSADKTHPMSEARGILKVVDDAMYDMNFVCSSMNQVPNLEESIYRINARYEGETDGTKFYRR